MSYSAYFHDTNAPDSTIHVPEIPTPDTENPKTPFQEWVETQTNKFRNIQIFKDATRQTKNWFFSATEKGNIPQMRIYLMTHLRNPTTLSQALHRAIDNDQWDAVQFLLTYKPPLEQCNEDQLAPIHLAAQRGLLRLISWLVHAGAIVDLPCRETGETALHMAVRGKKETVDRLLSRGARADIRDNDGNTALHAAAAVGTVAMVERLLHARSNVFEQNNDGKTPLEVATARGSLEVVEYLADFEARPAWGRR